MWYKYKSQRHVFRQLRAFTSSHCAERGICWHSWVPAAFRLSWDYWPGITMLCITYLSSWAFMANVLDRFPAAWLLSSILIERNRTFLNTFQKIFSNICASISKIDFFCCLLYGRDISSRCIKDAMVFRRQLQHFVALLQSSSITEEL